MRDLNNFDDYPHKAHLSRGFTKRDALLEAQNHRCAYCGIALSLIRHSHDEATVDHVVPRVAGGRPIWSNEVMACRLCNEGRGAMRADKYFQRVLWRGRIKAARYGKRRWMKIRKAKFSGTGKIIAPQFGAI